MKIKIMGLLLFLILPVLVQGKSFEPVPPDSIYHNCWIDLNKNEQMDPYENLELSIAKRIDDLLSRMSMEEKTAQMATLYGYGHV